MSTIMINGQWQTQLSALDRGLAYGDGVFRTLRVEQGQPLQWARHWQKLQADAAKIGLTLPPVEIFNAEVKAFLAAQSPTRGCLKITLTRGIGERGYRLPTQTTTTRILQSSPLPDRYHNPEAVRVRLCHLKLAEQPALAGIKHLNRLENVLARAEWQDETIFEGILCNTRDLVIGGVMSNIFMLHGKVLSTPELRTSGVAGVVREQLLEEATAQFGWQTKVRPLTLADLRAAQAVFLSNSLFGVVPVSEVIGMRQWQASPSWANLQAWQAWRQC